MLQADLLRHKILEFRDRHMLVLLLKLRLVLLLLLLLSLLNDPGLEQLPIIVILPVHKLAS